MVPLDVFSQDSQWLLLFLVHPRSDKLLSVALPVGSLPSLKQASRCRKECLESYLTRLTCSPSFCLNSFPHHFHARQKLCSCHQHVYLSNHSSSRFSPFTSISFYLVLPNRLVGFVILTFLRLLFFIATTGHLNW